MGSNPDSPVQSLYGMREAVAQVENMIGDGQYYRSLTVGLGITYGIHITHRFIEDVNTSDDLIEASKKTILNTGYALFGAAATTIAGFGLPSFSLLPPLQQFGQVTALAILYSFLSSIIVLPALLIIWAKVSRRMRRRNKLRS